MKRVNLPPCSLAGPVGLQARWPGPVMASTIDGLGPFPPWLEDGARATFPLAEIQRHYGLGEVE